MVEQEVLKIRRGVRLNGPYEVQQFADAAVGKEGTNAAAARSFKGFFRKT